MYLNKYNLLMHDYQYDSSDDDEDLMLVAKVYNWWKRIPMKYHFKHPYLVDNLKNDKIILKKCNIV